MGYRSLGEEWVTSATVREALRERCSLMVLLFSATQRTWSRGGAEGLQRESGIISSVWAADKEVEGSHYAAVAVAGLELAMQTTLAFDS